MNYNKAVLIGNLTRDPELRTMPNGQPVVNFGLATNRVYRDKEGNKKEDTQFHNIVIYGRMAENAAKYLARGSSVLIEGRIQNRSYDDKSGQKRYISEIIAQGMQFGPRRGGAAPAAGPAPVEAAAPDSAPEIPVVSEDEETPQTKSKVKNQKSKSPIQTEKSDEEFDIEEDIPF